MTPTEKRQRAEVARSLSDAFSGLLQEIRDEQVALFLKSGPDEACKREEAHALTRALTTIERKIRSHINAPTLKKKDQHRE